MGVIREYIKIDCGIVNYFIIRHGNIFYTAYADGNKKLKHFGTCQSLKLCYNMIRYNILGLHSAKFSIKELRHNSSDIKVREFDDGFLLVKS